MVSGALSILSEHSDFECSEGRLAFRRSIQILNAQMGIGHFRSIQILNAQMSIGIPKEHSDFGCSDGHSTAAFRFRTLRFAFGIPQEHSDNQSSDGHWAFHLNIQKSNSQSGIGHSTGAFRF